MHEPLVFTLKRVSKKPRRMAGWGTKRFKKPPKLDFNGDPIE